MKIAQHFVTRVSLQRDKIASFENYPFNIPLIREFDKLELHPQVTFLIGENGSGKSTLLEAIAVALGFNAEGGTRNFKFATRDSHSCLHEYLRIAQGSQKPRDGFFLRAESFFNVATEIERMDAEPSGAPPLIKAYGGRSLHEQSHGEAFLTLMTRRFGGRSLFLLDEPEAALSPQRQLTVLARMHQLVQAGSQFIIASHSPILLGYPDAAIYECSAEGLKSCSWVEAGPVQVMRRFLADRNGMLDKLFSQPEDSANDPS